MSGSFTYTQLELDSARWYWNKQPLDLKGERVLAVALTCQLTVCNNGYTGSQLCTSWMCNPGLSWCASVRRIRER